MNSPTRSLLMVMPRLSTTSLICSTVGRFTVMTCLLLPVFGRPGSRAASADCRRAWLRAYADEFVDEAMPMQFVRLGRMHDRPFLDDQDSLGQGGDEVEILLDQDHRQPAL